MLDIEIEKKKDEIRNKALKKISYRIRTEKEIREYLESIEDNKSLIEDTIKFLKEYKYIDDIFYAKAYYKDAKLKLKGEIRIKNELKRKGVSDSNISYGIEMATGEEDSEVLSDFDTAFIIYERMKKDQLSLNKALDDKFRAKVLRRLISKGYSNDICFKVFKRG